MSTRKPKGGQSIEAIKAEVDPAPQIRAMTDRNKKLERLVRDLKKEIGELELRVDSVRGMIDPITPDPLQWRPSKKSSSITSPVTMVAHLTDWHIGKQQQAGEVEGFGAFDPGIADARIEALGLNLVKKVSLQRHAFRVDDLAVIVTGDMMNGSLRAGDERTNAWVPERQVVEAARRISAFVAGLAPHFETVTVHYVTADNHSRTDRKPQSALEGTSSFNYILGHMTEAYLANHATVDFRIYPVSLKTIEVNRRRYLICHGHQFRGGSSWGGIPYYGMERAAGKHAMARMHMDRSMQFHKVVMGHWHVPAVLKDQFVGGSLSGTDNFDFQSGRVALPHQTCWFVHPKHGEFDWTAYTLDQGIDREVILVQ